MANQWVRLWVDMANDPKWRTIARASKQSISSVMAVYIHLLTSAANANERGRTQVNDEDIASALDMEIEDVTAIRKAMQGRVIDGETLTGWDKRQPAREDNSAERSKVWREQKKASAETERNRTQPNATERQIREEEIRKEEIKEEKKEKTKERSPQKRGSRLSQDWEPAWELVTWASTERPDLDIVTEIDRFRDHWIAKPGKDGLKLNWDATWRNWIRNAKNFNARGPQRPSGGANETSCQHRKLSVAERATEHRKRFEQQQAAQDEREIDGEFVGTDESHLSAQVG
jgi:hypothetical protein